MLRTIQLNHQISCGTVEVHYVISDNLLPIDGDGQLLQAFIPQTAFFFRHTISQVLCIACEPSIPFLVHRFLSLMELASLFECAFPQRPPHQSAQALPASPQGEAFCAYPLQQCLIAAFLSQADITPWLPLEGKLSPQRLMRWKAGVFTCCLGVQALPSLVYIAYK